MKYIDKIRKKTKESIPKQVKKEINNIKLFIENTAERGESEFRIDYQRVKFPEEVFNYFRNNGFDIEIISTPRLAIPSWIIIKW